MGVVIQRNREIDQTNDLEKYSTCNLRSLLDGGEKGDFYNHHMQDPKYKHGIDMWTYFVLK